jgi:pimeloyl-ACP methyl ester carboxylesterase
MLEAQECWRALQAAGEPGPFVLVGHSFGGFLAACMARKCPQRMAALVLLDATPPDTIIFGPRFGALRAMRRGAYVGGLLRLFGIHQSPLERAQRRQAPQIFELIDRLAGEAGRAERALAIRSRTPFAMASIFGELSPAGMATCAYDTATYDGDLGDLPVLLVAPGDARDADAAPEVGNAKGPERERVRRVLARSRERYLAISSNARRVVTPPGTEHVFPLQVPEFVVEVVREQVRACTPAAR